MEAPVMASLSKIKAILIDLSGTLHVGDVPTTNAVAALQRLRTLPVHIRFVTNTTKESRHSLTQRLTKTIGFQIEQHEIYSSLSAAVDYVKEHKLNPFYLLSQDARTDFPEGTSTDHDSVVVGLAPDEFHYENLNRAFNILKSSLRLIAIHEGKYLKREDGLAIGPGFFTKGLEYSAGVKATVVGKPNQYFFRSAIPEGCEPENCVMIGDDINDDIAGAMSIGMMGVLVKTGKYLPDVSIAPPPTTVLENFSEAVHWIAQQISAESS